MARIPNEEIERLKKEIPIERLVTGFGVIRGVIRDMTLKHN